MTCQEFRDSMPELSEGLAEEVQAHARQCGACALVLEHHRALAAGLGAVAAEWRRVKAPNRIEAKLLAEFRGQAGVVELPAARWRWKPVAAWLAAAAVVAAATLLFVVRTRQLHPSQRPTMAAEMASVDWASQLPEEAANADSGEFIPMPNADRLPPNDHLNVVRVELPRSSMIALGYLVTADRADEKIQADVVLGSDGLARAVRFVNE